MFQEGLYAHPDKTGFIVFGSPEYKKNVDKQLEHNQLYFGGRSQTNALGKYCIEMGQGQVVRQLSLTERGK